MSMEKIIKSDMGLEEPYITEVQMRVVAYINRDFERDETYTLSSMIEIMKDDLVHYIKNVVTPEDLKYNMSYSITNKTKRKEFESPGLTNI